MTKEYFAKNRLGFKMNTSLVAAALIMSATLTSFSGVKAQEEEKTTKTMDSQVTGNPVRLDVDADCSIESMTMKAESANAVQDSGYDYPQGLMHFTIDCKEEGFTANIKQIYWNSEKEFSETTVRKYNPSTNAYFNVSGSEISKELFGSYMITATYQVKDGSSMDADGEANGVIVDPAGVALAAVTPPKTGFGGALNNLIVKLFFNR